MKLSDHFTLEEMTRSEAAERMGDDNAPTEAHLANLRVLAKNMEKVRTICGDRPIVITSAYRNPAVNKAVGGVKTSAHAQGFACDFMVMGLTLQKAAAVIALSGIEFDQLILESSRGVLHISFEPRARKQLLTQAGPAGSEITKGIQFA